MERLVQKMIDVVRKCGQIILNADRSSIEIDSKAGFANFVTEYDKKVQDLLEEKLSEIVPDAKFVGEEENSEKVTPTGKYFVVDPIDGTTNFIKDYHVSSISVALIENGKVRVGIVYNPYLDEMFWAQRGHGAYCNDRKIHVSDQPLSNGIVMFGTSLYYPELNEQTFKMAYDYFRKALDVRRSGSAAIDLCSVAAGRAELFFELRLSPWDYAAASLIVEEAGGVVTTVEGDTISFENPCSVLARNKKIADAEKQKREFIGIQYNATGIFGYSFRENEKEVFKTGCLVIPNPDVELIGFGKELWHRNLDGEITLVPGIRRNITDETGNVKGYYKYRDFNQFSIIADNTELRVQVFENGWKVYYGTELVASIYRFKVSEREQFVENGIDMETRFSVSISEAISDSVYPYIFAVPMLGF